jgi:hypothetical protein
MSPEPAEVEVAAKVRRTRDELRDLVLEAGRDLLMSEGLGTGAEHLTFKRVLAHVEETTGVRVTNASVIRRIWDNQEEFQLEEIRSVADIQGDLEVEATSQAFDEAVAMVDLNSPELRRASLSELIRISCAEYISSASTSDAAIQMALATYISANSRSGRGSPLVESFRMTNDRLTRRYMELYEAGLQLVGWRMKPGLSLRDAASVISALAEGVLMRLGGRARVAHHHSPGPPPGRRQSPLDAPGHRHGPDRRLLHRAGSRLGELTARRPSGGRPRRTRSPGSWWRPRSWPPSPSRPVAWGRTRS